MLPVGIKLTKFLCRNCLSLEQSRECLDTVADDVSGVNCDGW